jgi:hypothetical protein
MTRICCDCRHLTMQRRHRQGTASGATTSVIRAEAIPIPPGAPMQIAAVAARAARVRLHAIALRPEFPDRRPRSFSQAVRPRGADHLVLRSGWRRGPRLRLLDEVDVKAHWPRWCARCRPPAARRRTARRGSVCRVSSGCRRAGRDAGRRARRVCRGRILGGAGETVGPHQFGVFDVAFEPEIRYAVRSPRCARWAVRRRGLQR